MSYMRGRFYVWRDETYMHVWAADGDDGWRESIWAAQYIGTPDNDAPGGTKIPLDTLDELVAMRLAQLIADGHLIATIDRALEKHGGNFGCNALDQLASSLKSALASIQ